MTASVPSPSPLRRLKRVALLFAAVLGLAPVAGYVALSSVDFSRFIPYLQQQVKQSTGRELTVAGDVQVAFGLTPSLTLGKVALSNPDWTKHPALFSAEKISIRVELLPLLKREVVIRTFSAEGAAVALEENAAGDASWILKAKPKERKGAATAAKPTSAEHAPAFTLHMGEVTLRDTRITYRNSTRGEETTVTLPSVTLTAEENVRVTAQLAREGFTGTLTLEGAKLREFAEKPVTAALELHGAAGAALKAHGKVTHLADTPELALDVEAEADSLAAFSPLAGATLPETESLSFTAEATGRLRDVTLDNFQAEIGETSASGRAHLRFGGGKPLLTATIGIPSYTLPETKASASAGVGTVANVPEGKRVLPDILFPAGIPGAIDADVEFTVGAIHTGTQTMESVMGHLMLKKGILQIDPLQFKLRKGRVKGRFAYNADRTQPSVHLSFTAEGEDFGAFLAALGTTKKMEGGTFSGELAIEGVGTGLRAMLPSISGTASLMVENAALKDPNLQEATALADAMQGKERSGDVAVNCALGKLNIRAGVGTPEYLVADMKHLRIYGEGSVDLPQELLGLKFYPQPKSAGFSELAFPVKIKGSFADPKITPDRTQAAFSITKMFVDSKKLGGLETLLGTGGNAPAAGKDMSGLHPCLTPIATPQGQQEAPSLKDAVDEKKDALKKDIRHIEKEVKTLRDGLLLRLK